VGVRLLGEDVAHPAMVVVFLAGVLALIGLRARFSVVSTAEHRSARH
jgi:hypothetical protein